MPGIWLLPLFVLPRLNAPGPFRVRSPAPVLERADVPISTLSSVRSFATSRIAVLFRPAFSVRPGTVSPVPVYLSVPGPSTSRVGSSTHASESITTVPLPVTTLPVKSALTFETVTVPQPVAFVLMPTMSAPDSSAIARLPGTSASSAAPPNVL